MIFLLIAVSFFMVCILLHIQLHNFLAKRNIMTLKTVYIFIAGALLLAVTLQTLGPFVRSITAISDAIKEPLFFSSLCLYILLSVSFTIFFASPFLGDESPSSKIYLLLKKNGTMTKEELLSYFTDKEIVLKRIDNLIFVGWIEVKNNHLRVTKKGKFIASLIFFNRTLLNAHLIG